tara:strand:- start:7726 stop:8397 length:672 start_codon:yes stop_codon:yes gene_type:complete
MKKNFYEVLNIQHSATFEEIKEAYQKAKLSLSQDNMALYSIMSSSDIEENISQIEEAFNILGNERNRRKYHLENDFSVETIQEKTQTEPTITQKVSAEEQIQATNTKTKPEKKISNLVASNKFALKYDTDPIFEKEIKETKEFSGETLKKVREYKNVDIARMCEMTRISKTHLKNIEEENISALPARVYTRGFVYQYAKCLKMNPEEVAASYMNRVDQKQQKI